MSPMETGAEAATETIGEEMGAVRDRAKVALTQMKIVIGPVVAARATDTVAAVAETVEVTTTAEAVAPVLVRPDAIVEEATTSTASAKPLESAAATVAERNAASVAARRHPSPKSPRMTVTSAPSSSSRSLSVQRPATYAASSSRSDPSSRLRSSKIVSLVAQRGKHILSLQLDATLLISH